MINSWGTAAGLKHVNSGILFKSENMIASEQLFLIPSLSASGVIRTTETLDRETVSHYWLSVYVTDLGTEPLIAWTHVFLEVLDVNDNAPELSQPVYFATVQENMDKVKSVVQVSATDADTSSDGKLSYQMLESHRTYFDVDPKTGN